MTKLLSNSLGFIADIKVHISKNTFLIAASLTCNDEKSKLKSFFNFFYLCNNYVGTIFF